MTAESRNSTPQEIHKIVEFLTGINFKGVVEKQEHLEGEVYRINLIDGYLICIKHEAMQIWSVIQFEQDETPIHSWSNLPTEETQFGIQLINALITNNGKITNPVFQKQAMNSEIGRKTYNTDIGVVIIHTRRHPVGTEIVVEIPNQETIMRCIWERSTGSIDINKVEYLLMLPF